MIAACIINYKHGQILLWTRGLSHAELRYNPTWLSYLFQGKIIQIIPWKTRKNCPYAATFWDIYSISQPIYIYIYIHIYKYIYIYIYMFYSSILWQHFHLGCYSWKSLPKHVVFHALLRAEQGRGGDGGLGPTGLSACNIWSGTSGRWDVTGAQSREAAGGASGVSVSLI